MNLGQYLHIFHKGCGTQGVNTNVHKYNLLSRHFKIVISSQDYPGTNESKTRLINFGRKKVLKLYIYTTTVVYIRGTVVLSNVVTFSLGVYKEII